MTQPAEPPTSTPPNPPRARTLRWGVLGTAGINDAMIPALQRAARSEVVAVASRSAARARSHADRFGVPDAESSYRSLLDRDDIDAVYVPLPNALHAEWTLAAIARGLAVLCEKPLALDAVEAARVRDAAAAAGVVVVEGYMHRFHPLYRVLTDTIASGEIGALRSIHARFTFRSDPDHAVVTGAALGGGALRDVGGYPITAARLLAGESPCRVSAVLERGADGADLSVAGTLRFPSGVLATIEASVDADEDHRLEVVGTRGRLVSSDPWVCVDRPSVVHVVRERAPIRELAVPPEDPYRAQVDDFVRAVLDGAEPRYGLDDALEVAAIIDAMRASDPG